jgi:hypothetical protein
MASGLVIQRSVTKAEAKIPKVEMDHGNISRDIKGYQRISIL